MIDPNRKLLATAAAHYRDRLLRIEIPGPYELYPGALGAIRDGARAMEDNSRFFGVYALCAVAAVGWVALTIGAAFAG